LEPEICLIKYKSKENKINKANKVEIKLFPAHCEHTALHYTDHLDNPLAMSVIFVACNLLGRSPACGV
jgi:ribosomal protein L33